MAMPKDDAVLRVSPTQLIGGVQGNDKLEGDAGRSVRQAPHQHRKQIAAGSSSSN
jgi:hypothetical protein